MNSRLLRFVSNELSLYSFSADVCKDVVEYVEVRGHAIAPDALLKACGPRAMALLSDVALMPMQYAELMCYEGIGCMIGKLDGNEAESLHVMARDIRTGAVGACLWTRLVGPLHGTAWIHNKSFIGDEWSSGELPVHTIDRWARLLGGDGVGMVSDNDKEGDRWIVPPWGLVADATGMLEPICRLVAELAKVSVLTIADAAFRFCMD